MKIYVLVTYYNRPLLLRKALESVLAASTHHGNLRLLVGDDNSPIPAEPIAREVLGSLGDHTDFIRSATTLEEKLSQGTSIGKFANEYILASEADIIITLCDDDR